MISALTVLYDETCPVCRRARRWVERQFTHIPVEFVPAGSAAAERRFPDLDHAATRRQITVVADDFATGRRRWLFGGLTKATERVRRQTAGELDPAGPWPPPNPAGRRA